MSVESPTTDDRESPIRRATAVVRRHLVLVYSLLYQDLLLRVRYPLNSLSSIVTMYGFFLVIFLGGKQVAGTAFSDSLGGIIVGFFFFTMAQTSLFGAASTTMREAQWGTLEQLFLSPNAFEILVTYRAFLGMLINFCISSVLLALMLITTGEQLAIHAATVFVVGTVSIASVIGVGLVLGGLAVVHKRVNNLFGPIRFGLMFVIAAPFADVPFYRLLPLSLGSQLLHRSMVEGVTLWEFPVGDLLSLVAISAGYLAVGVVLFHLFVRRGRRQGTLGDY